VCKPGSPSKADDHLLPPARLGIPRVKQGAGDGRRGGGWGRGVGGMFGRRKAGNGFG